MKQVQILKSDTFSIVSYGNGSAYCFENIKQNLSVWLQGGDAVEFWSEYEAYSATMDDNKAFAELWNNYSCIAA